MESAAKLVKNTLYLGVAHLCSPLISMLLIIYISRELGADGLGVYSASLAFVFFFEKFAQLGIHQLILRDVASDTSRCKPYLIGSTVIGLISSLVSLPILYGVLALIHYPAAVSKGVLILSGSIVFVVLSYYYQAVLEGLQRMERRSVLSFVDAITRVGLGILLVHLGYGATGALVGVVMGRVVTCLCALRLVIRFADTGSSRIQFQLIRSLLNHTFTFLMISLVTTVFWRIDFVMLSKMRGPTDVGLYSAAYRVLEILTSLTYSYIAALFPIMAASAGASPSSLKRQCELSIKYLFILTFPVSIGVWLLAPEIIAFIYGARFDQSIQVLQILIWSICIFPLALICARALVATNHQRYDLYANISLITSNILANLVLIPPFGPAGAAVATLISVTAFLCVEALFVSRHLSHIDWGRLLAKPILAGAVMAVSAYSLRHLNPTAVAIFSAGLYVIVLLLLRTFSDAETATFRRLFRRLSLACSEAD